MNKSELIDAISSKTGLTKVDSKKMFEAYTEVVKETLQSGDKIAVVGFGTFSVLAKSARTGINPQTKKPINIAAKKVAKFKPGSDLELN